jgi:hypothetical protein
MIVIESKIRTGKLSVIIISKQKSLNFKTEEIQLITS